MLGVMFSIPLRHVMVVQSELPYPEGVAAAEILRVGSAERAQEAQADAAPGRRPSPPPPAWPISRPAAWSPRR